MAQGWSQKRAETYLTSIIASLEQRLSYTRELLRHEPSVATEDGFRAALMLVEQDLGEEEIEALIASSQERRCRECFCTDDNCEACFERTGEPCSWVDEDLCSACIPEAEQA